VPGGDRGSHGRVGEGARPQVGELEEHLSGPPGTMRARNRPPVNSARVKAPSVVYFPDARARGEWQLAWLMTVWRRGPG